jgi:hypothetical protein
MWEITLCGNICEIGWNKYNILLIYCTEYVRYYITIFEFIGTLRQKILALGGRLRGYLNIT